MDAGPIKPGDAADAPWRPEGCDKIGLILQGGGALGAYQAGVYEALHEAGLEPDWVAGVSIGGINAAIIAGNPPERRAARLREFWNLVTSRPVWAVTPDGDTLRRLHNVQSAWMTLNFGQPGFFEPLQPGPWQRLRGAWGATFFYDSAPLRETLLKLVDFGRLNGGEMRYACGAVNVATGNFAYFDNADTVITPEHVMASGALPPALPMVQIGSDHFWDGGIVSNTPLQHLLDNNSKDDMLVFQVDLFSARGPLPRDMMEVTGRQKDIQYSSRTRLVSTYYMQMHKMRVQMKKLLALLPDDRLDDEQKALKAKLDDLPRFNLLQLIYQQSAWESEAKDYDFSASSMRHHWDMGGRDTRLTLGRREWLEMPDHDTGIVSHDIHRALGA